MNTSSITHIHSSTPPSYNMVTRSISRRAHQLFQPVPLSARRYKTLIIGDADVGKSALMERFKSMGTHVHSWAPLRGHDVRDSAISFNTTKGPVVIEIRECFDMSFDHIAESYISIDRLIPVVAVDSVASFAYLKEIIPKLMAYKKSFCEMNNREESITGCLLLANKSDLEGIETKYLFDQNVFPSSTLMKISAKTSNSCDDCLNHLLRRLTRDQSIELVKT